MTCSTSSSWALASRPILLGCNTLYQRTLRLTSNWSECHVWAVTSAITFAAVVSVVGFFVYPSKLLKRVRRDLFLGGTAVARCSIGHLALHNKLIFTCARKVADFHSFLFSSGNWRAHLATGVTFRPRVAVWHSFVPQVIRLPMLSLAGCALELA